MQYLSFFIWLISLSIIPSRFFHVLANGKISFLFYGWVISLSLSVRTCTHLYSSVSGHLGCVHILALWIMVHWTLGCVYHFELVFSFSSDKYPEVKLLVMQQFCFYEAELFLLLSFIFNYQIYFRLKRRILLNSDQIAFLLLSSLFLTFQTFCQSVFLSSFPSVRRTPCKSFS